MAMLAADAAMAGCSRDSHLRRITFQLREVALAATGQNLDSRVGNGAQSDSWFEMAHINDAHASHVVGGNMQAFQR